MLDTDEKLGRDQIVIHAKVFEIFFIIQNTNFSQLVI